MSLRMRHNEVIVYVRVIDLKKNRLEAAGDFAPPVQTLHKLVLGETIATLPGPKQADH